MIAQRMIRSAHAQTQERAGEETAKGEHVRRRGRRVPRGDHRLVQGQRSEARADEDDGAQKVRPNVDGLIVHGEDGGEGVAVAVAGRPVAGGDEGVVAAPVGEFVPGEEQGSLDLLFHGLDGVQESVA